MITQIKGPSRIFKLFLTRKFANFYPTENFIGVVGSVGKTITVQAINSVLSSKFNTLITRNDKESLDALTETLIKFHPKNTKIILELGIEYPGESDLYLSLLKPTNLVVTKISYEHSFNLGNIDQIFDEYKKLVQSLPETGFAIINWDDIYARKLETETKAQVIFYGTNQKNCHLWADNIRVSKNFTYFELNYGVERVNVELRLVGRHMVYAALAASALGVSMGLSLFSIKKGLEKTQPLKHRLEVLEGVNGSQVLDDSWSSYPSSVEEALNVLNELSARRRIAVIGEMRDLGSFSKQLHIDIARKIFKDRTIDFLLLSGGDAKIIAEELSDLGYQGKVELGLSHSQIVSYILRNAENGDCILIKGDKSMKLNEIVERIKKQK